MQPSAIVVNQLLTNARAGSSSAVEELLAAYGDYLRMLAGQRLGGRLAGRLSPSDLVQETLLAAWKDFETFRGTDAPQFALWIRTILLRKVSAAITTHLKASKRGVDRECSLSPSSGSSVLEIVKGLQSREETPSKVISNGEQNAIIERLMQQLPEDYRLVIQWRNLDGVQFNDIAKRLGRTSGAARLLWLRAIRLLQELSESQNP